MFGTIVNALAIAAGGIMGTFFKNGLKDRYKSIVMQGIGLSVIIIGITGALKTSKMLLIIISIVVGSLLGEWMNIEERLNTTGEWLQKKLGGKHTSLSKGFVTASLIYCVGAMAVAGSLESGLTGVHDTLFAKSILDGITSVILASTLGIGVAFSALSVFLYQGTITVLASLLGFILVDSVIADMSAVGGILIMAIGINLLEIKKFKVGNMLPAIFIPLFYYVLILGYNNIRLLF